MTKHNFNYKKKETIFTLELIIKKNGVLKNLQMSWSKKALLDTVKDLKLIGKF